MGKEYTPPDRCAPLWTPAAMTRARWPRHRYRRASPRGFVGGRGAVISSAGNTWSGPVHWLDLPDHDSTLENASPPPSARRRAASRLSLGLGAALAAATLGVLA